MQKQDDDKFDKLFRYVQEMRVDMDARFDDMHRKFSQLQSSVDGISAQMEDDQLERMAMASQVNRHDEWIMRAAKKLQLKYSES